MPGESVNKVCCKCQVDVSQAKRHKDAKGRYWCEPCFAKAAAEAKQAGAADKASGASGAGVAAGAATPAWLAGSMAVEGKRCTACSAAMPKEGVICTSCGHNSETGKVLGTRVVMAPKEKSAKSGGALGGVGKALEGPALIGLSTVGGLVGGGVGAAFYAMITQASGYEIWFLVWIIGVTTGAGVAYVAKGYRGITTGLIAVTIAFIAFIGGRFWAISMIMDKLVAEMRQSEEVGELTDHDAKVAIADTVATEWETAGRALKWPDGMTLEDAYEAEDYPQEVWGEATKRWEAMSSTQKVAFLNEIQKRGQQNLKDYGTIAIFFASIGIRHILALVVLIAGAWKFGAG